MSKKIIALALSTLLLCSGAFCDELLHETEVPAGSGTSHVDIIPSIVFNEGLAFAQVTRIIGQSKYGRSNFVYQDYLAGLAFSYRTFDIQPADHLLRLSLYYPVKQTFNGMDQKNKQMFLYGLDLFFAPVFESSMWQYVNITFSPGLHFMYQKTDFYRYLYTGFGAQAGIGLPVSKHWSILMNGYCSVDYANFGSNKTMAPVDFAYSAQLELCMRYSGGHVNKYSYIK